MKAPQKPTLRCECGRSHDRIAFQYSAPPAGETKFDFGAAPYKRCYLRCEVCAHWYSETDMDLSALYGGAYVDSTYGAKMRATYDRIMALPPEKSDNAARAARVQLFASHVFPERKQPSLLDVGSGLAVFPARMKALGWRCTALDPDPRAAQHARDVVGVEAIAGDFMAQDRLGRYDAVSFNKVLEHVLDPVAMLEKAARHLEPKGFIYVEVPDGEAAAAEGPGREEFFIEHHHVFSPESVHLMARNAGLQAVTVERVREPSTKFTLRAFLAL